MRNVILVIFLQLLVSSFSYAHSSSDLVKKMFADQNSDVSGIIINNRDSAESLVARLTGIGSSHRYSACSDSSGESKEIFFDLRGRRYNCYLEISRLPFNDFPEGTAIDISISECEPSFQTGSTYWSVGNELLNLSSNRATRTRIDDKLLSCRNEK